MKIFFSHSGRDKALVREIIRHLPKNIKAWIDEDELLAGENLTSSLRETIQYDTDFLILFISNDSVQSSWVNQELSWAIERESELRRTFILPVVIENDAWDKIEPKSFQERMYIELVNQTESNVKAVAENIKNQLFNHLTLILEGKDKQRVIEGIVIDKLVRDIPGKVDKQVEEELSFFKQYIIDISGTDSEFAIKSIKDRINKEIKKAEDEITRIKKDINPDSSIPALLVCNLALKTFESIVEIMNRIDLVIQKVHGNQIDFEQGLQDIYSILNIRNV